MVDFDALPKKKKQSVDYGIKVTDKKFVRYAEGAQRYSMGLHTFQKLAKEAKAIYRVGRMILINTEILDAYMESFREYKDDLS